MPPRTTLWSLDKHTYGKHLVLKSYMDAWLPILLSRYPNALFVDAFAGPGEYKNGQPGSPVIALEALATHRSSSRLTGHMDYIFVEERPDRFRHLQQVLTRLDSQHRVPQNCHIQSFNVPFEQVLPKITTDIATARLPAFVMIDPFGVSGVSMASVKRLLDHPSTEVYISFMYTFSNRFRRQPDFAARLDELFGCTDWRKGIDIKDATERRDFFYGLYTQKLKEAGAQYVLRFELYKGRRLGYTLFFATQSEQGCDKMKQAMWKVAPFGSYSFRGDTLGQLSFESGIVGFDELKELIVDEFGLNQPTPIESITKFMCSDRILFHSGHMKSRLADMERKTELSVDESPRKQRYAFPPGTILRFLPPPSPQPKQGEFILP